MAARTAADMADELTRPFGRVAIEVGAPDGDGWAPFPATAEPSEVALAHIRVAEDNGIRAQTAAMWLAAFVTSVAVAPALRAHRLHGVLLDVPFDSLRIMRDPGRGYRTVAVPPDALVVDAEPAARLRRIAGMVVEGMQPLVDGLLARCRITSRALWGAVADGVTAETLQLLMADFDDRDSLLAEMEVLFDAAPSINSRPTWDPVEMGGRTIPVPCRAICCVAYRGRPGRCSTCPSMLPEERLANLMRRTGGGDGKADPFAGGR